MRMKSFSVDTPEPPRQATIAEEGSMMPKHKSGSFSSTSTAGFAEMSAMRPAWPGDGSLLDGANAPGSSKHLASFGSGASSPAGPRNFGEGTSSGSSWRDSGNSRGWHSSGSGDSDSRRPSSSPRPASPQTQRTRKKRLNMRMKSFSVDTPDPPKPPKTIDETSKKKSSSFTSAAGCFGGMTDDAMSCVSGSTSPPSPISPGPVHQRRSKFSMRSSSVEIDDDESHSPLSNYSLSPRAGNSPKSQRRYSYSSQHVVLYNFKPKGKGDLELKAGCKVNAFDTSDPAWWRGKSSGRVGYFPSSYVARLNPGERVLQVVSSLEVSEGSSGTKLLKDQIVIQEAESTEEGILMIRTADMTRLPCPSRYLTEVDA